MQHLIWKFVPSVASVHHIYVVVFYSTSYAYRRVLCLGIMLEWGVMWLLSYSLPMTSECCNIFSVFSTLSTIDQCLAQTMTTTCLYHIYSCCSRSLSIMPYTSASKKTMIVTRKEEGMSVRKIAEKENINPSTVSWVIQRYGETHDFESISSKTGQPHKMSEKDA